VGHVPVAQPSSPRRVGVSGRFVGVIALLAALGVVLAVAMVFAWPTGSQVQPSSERWVTVGAEDDFVLWEPARRLVTSPDGIEYDVYIVRLPEETLALWTRDPHQGCTVPWRPDFEFMGRAGWFRNPCHGETYDLTGHLVFGPSPRGLDRLAIRLANGSVQVDTGEVIEGPPYEPQHFPVTPP
jgi:Rieske Fe-S protein